MHPPIDADKKDVHLFFWDSLSAFIRVYLRLMVLHG